MMHNKINTPDRCAPGDFFVGVLDYIKMILESRDLDYAAGIENTVPSTKAVNINKVLQRQEQSHQVHEIVIERAEH